MSNVLSEEKKQQVIALGRLGWPLRRIDQGTGVRRETAGFGVEWSGSGPKDPKHALSTSFCEPFRDAIELSLSRDRNAMAIWQDLVSESGFRGGYQTVKRFVRKLRGNRPLQPRAVIVTAPGEEAQVDYGTGPMVRDPQTGKYRRTRLFVLTLGYSRKAVRLLTFRS